MKNYIHILNNNKILIFFSILYFLLTIGIGNLTILNLGNYTVLDCVLYFFIQIVFLNFIMLSSILNLRNKDITVLNKVLLILISSIYFLIFFTYIAHEYWRMRTLMYITIILSIQTIYSLILYKNYEMFKYKKELLKNFIVFTCLSIVGISYSYYEHSQLMVFCKTVTTEKDSIYCLKKLDPKIGYRDNFVIGSHIATILKSNPLFKEHIERVMEAKVIVRNNDVEWHPIHTPIK